VRPSTAKNAVLCHAGVKDSGCEPKPNPNELEQTFALLGSSEQMVLRLRSGLVDGHRHSLREVGTFLGTSRAVVRSLEWQGWQKLQAHAQSNQSASESVYYILDRCRTRKPKIN
jgi:hypothetical protein